MRLRLGRRLVDLLPAAPRANALTIVHPVRGSIQYGSTWSVSLPVPHQTPGCLTHSLLILLYIHETKFITCMSQHL